jgi:predicted metal-dependent phosphoesterase TrpH
LAKVDGAAGIADLHIHTHHSDGQDGPAEVVAWAARIRLDVIAITDHDQIDGALIAAAIARREPGSPDVIVGEEVSSLDGHILALYIEGLVPPDMSAAKTIAAIHEQGGLAVAAHPYWRTSSTDHKGRLYGIGDRIADLDFDAVEVINGGFTPSMIGANRRAGWVAEALGRTPIGGSDAHVKHALGWGHTRFQGRTAHELRRSIEAGRTQAARSRLDPTGLSRYATWSLGRLRLRAAV